jgi:hypothetical protein
MDHESTLSLIPRELILFNRGSSSYNRLHGKFIKRLEINHPEKLQYLRKQQKHLSRINCGNLSDLNIIKSLKFIKGCCNVRKVVCDATVVQFQAKRMERNTRGLGRSIPRVKNITITGAPTCKINLQPLIKHISYLKILSIPFGVLDNWDIAKTMEIILHRRHITPDSLYVLKVSFWGGLRYGPDIGDTDEVPCIDRISQQLQALDNHKYHIIKLSATFKCIENRTLKKAITLMSIVDQVESVDITIDKNTIQALDSPINKLVLINYLHCFIEDSLSTELLNSISALSNHFIVNAFKVDIFNLKDGLACLGAYTFFAECKRNSNKLSKA